MLNYGIQYIGLGQLREIMTSKLGGAHSKDDLLLALTPYMDADKLVISDENILGGTDMPDSKKLYSKAVSRLSFLISIFHQYEVTTHITLRDYADYLVSRYCESLRHYKFRNFSTYYKNIDFSTLSWFDLLDDIHAAGCENLVVSDFNYAIRNNDDYFSELLGVNFQLDEANDGAAVRRSKMSLETIRILSALNKHYPPHIGKKLMNMMDNNKQLGTPTPFSPFKKEDLERLKSLYSEHMLLLKGNNKNIRVLGI